MKHNHEYKNEYPEIFRDEIDRVFGEILKQQVSNPEHQIYHLSLGTSIVTDIVLEFETLPHTSESYINSGKRKKRFKLQFTPIAKYKLAFLDLIFFLQSEDFQNYFTSQRNRNRRKNDTDSTASNKINKPSHSVYSISGEFLENESAYILGILKEIGQTICTCHGKIDKNKIGYLTGNILSKNQIIPTLQLHTPEVKNHVSQDILSTIEEKNMTGKRVSPSFFRNGQYRHLETVDVLKKVNEKSKLLLSLRDPTYMNETEQDQILSDYREVWQMILPNEVSRLIMNHRENSGFEMDLGIENIDPVYLKVGKLDKKNRERIIGFLISVIHSDADMLWYQLAENFKKYSIELGDYEFEVSHHDNENPDAPGKATIILEMPISLEQPEKIRDMLTLFGTLLFTHGNSIKGSPYITREFENSNGKLQSIAKRSLLSPKIKSSFDR